MERERWGGSDGREREMEREGEMRREDRMGNRLMGRERWRGKGG